MKFKKLVCVFTTLSMMASFGTSSANTIDYSNRMSVSATDGKLSITSKYLTYHIVKITNRLGQSKTELISANTDNIINIESIRDPSNLSEGSWLPTADFFMNGGYLSKETTDVTLSGSDGEDFTTSTFQIMSGSLMVMRDDAPFTIENLGAFLLNLIRVAEVSAKIISQAPAQKSIGNRQLYKGIVKAANGFKTNSEKREAVLEYIQLIIPLMEEVLAEYNDYCSIDSTGCLDPQIQDGIRSIEKGLGVARQIATIFSFDLGANDAAEKQINTLIAKHHKRMAEKSGKAGLLNFIRDQVDTQTSERMLQNLRARLKTEYSGITDKKERRDQFISNVAGLLGSTLAELESMKIQEAKEAELSGHPVIAKRLKSRALLYHAGVATLDLVSLYLSPKTSVFFTTQDTNERINILLNFAGGAIDLIIEEAYEALEDEVAISSLLQKNKVLSLATKQPLAKAAKLGATIGGELIPLTWDIILGPSGFEGDMENGALSQYGPIAPKITVTTGSHDAIKHSRTFEGFELDGNAELLAPASIGDYFMAKLVLNQPSAFSDQRAPWNTGSVFPSIPVYDYRRQDPDGYALGMLCARNTVFGSALFAVHRQYGPGKAPFKLSAPADLTSSAADATDRDCGLVVNPVEAFGANAWYEDFSSTATDGSVRSAKVYSKSDLPTSFKLSEVEELLGSAYKEVKDYENSWVELSFTTLETATLRLKNRVRVVPIVKILNATPTFNYADSNTSGFSVTLNLSHDGDPFDSITGTSIDWGDGSEVTRATTQHTYPEIRPYSVKITAYTKSGQQISQNVNIDIPTPQLSFMSDVIHVGEAVQAQLTGVWSNFKSLVLFVSNEISETFVNLTGSVSFSFPVIFDKAGEQVVTVTLNDGLDGNGATKATVKANVNVVGAQPVIEGNYDLFDAFDGTALRNDLWTSKGSPTCGSHQVTSGKATFFGGSSADTQDKKTFTGKKIVIEAIMGGTQGNRDTHFELVDVATGQTIQVGDTSDNATAAPGLYLATNPGSGKNDFDQRGIEATSAKLQAYRLTLQGQSATLERGDGFTGPMSTHTFSLPRSIAGKTFFLRVGTGADDCVHSPGTFDSIKVTTESVLTNELFDDFNGDALDLTKWTSAGYAYEVNANTSLAGSFTVGNGVIDLGYAGGVATFGKQHFKGHKIVVEARVARTGAGEFPIALVNTQDLRDRITISDTGYCGAGFLGGVAGRFQFSKMYPFCFGSYGYGFLLGKPAAVGEWMEYRLTVEGTKFTMERGPTLDNITQSATETMNLPIDPYEWFLYFRTGSSGGYYGAKFDWIRVNVTPSEP